ncbi:hypothetical protein DFA_10140 [Cavenderia fasciculata]|uniref:Uncharacterized protein n=1 Tax=Cavenderia fasciculata TaxID=261658 RepID=F4Q9D7_CACFS|nr:uncharacterized protein DFA_10140 [Cavenderia fasciculata]EGG15306.1 hypothetical protein DFA_10140 [Cavenderia fasciculata]|eukprot:XP_004352026.1 hypothetical protein DFA_10140 [Cavenderia fasciculata]
MSQVNDVSIVSSDNHINTFLNGIQLSKINMIYKQCLKCKEDNLYEIDNKYYNCKIQFKPVHLATNVDKNAKEKSGIAADATSYFAGELVVLVFDQSNEKSFNSIKSYHSKLVGESDGNESIVLVDVNNGKEISTGGSSVDITVIEEWCIENAIELIILEEEKHKKYDQQKGDTDDDQRIKYGVERIKELLETTMWSNMDYKTSNRPTAAASNDLSDDDEDNQQQQKSSSSLSNGDGSNKQQMDLITESLKRVEIYFDEGNKPPTKKTTTGSGGVESTEDEEVAEEFDQVALFEKTFSQLQDIRQQMQTMNDQDRRDMAAKIALMFASKLDGGNDDDDDL